MVLYQKYGVFNRCPGISDAREIPQQLAQSCVPQEYRQTVLDTVEQTVRNLQGQLKQTLAQQRDELLALDRSHNVARTAYQEGLQASQAARNAQLDSVHSAQVYSLSVSLSLGLSDSLNLRLSGC